MTHVTRLQIMQNKLDAMHKRLKPMKTRLDREIRRRRLHADNDEAPAEAILTEPCGPGGSSLPAGLADNAQKPIEGQGSAVG